MEKFIDLEATYDSKIFFKHHICESSISLTKIVFSHSSFIPEGYEIVTNNYVEQETLCAVLIEEDQIDEFGYEYDLWEENVEITKETYFKLAMDFNENTLVRDAKEILNPELFKFRLYYES